GLVERRLEVAGDQRADLLRLAVVGVVVAAGQRVRAQDDPPLDLRPEAGLAGQRHDVLQRPGAVVADPQAVPAAIEPGQVGPARAPGARARSPPPGRPYRTPSNRARLDEHSLGAIR